MVYAQTMSFSGVQLCAERLTTLLGRVRSRAQRRGAKCCPALHTLTKTTGGMLRLHWSEGAEGVHHKQSNSGIKVGLRSHLAAFTNNSVQTPLSEMVENPKWRPWLRFEEDMTIRSGNYTSSNALRITLAQNHSNRARKSQLNRGENPQHDEAAARNKYEHESFTNN